jgi:hypothetical protein
MRFKNLTLSIEYSQVVGRETNFWSPDRKILLYSNSLLIVFGVMILHYFRIPDFRQDPQYLYSH